MIAQMENKAEWTGDKRKTKRAAKDSVFLRICQNEKVLEEYLEERKEEVGTIMSMLFSQEEITDRYGYERYNEGLSKGLSEGVNKERENIALNMLRANMNIEQIIQCTTLPLTRINELAKTLS